MTDETTPDPPSGEGGPGESGTPASADDSQQPGIGSGAEDMFRGAADVADGFPTLRDDEVWHLEDARAGADPRGCAAVTGIALVFGVVLILAFAVIGLQLFSGLFTGGAGDGDDATPSVEGVGGTSADGSDQPSGSRDLPFVPRSGVYEIENLPFLEACGPGDLGSGFEEGTIEVAEDGSSLTATGSAPGSAAFDMQLVDQSPDQLVYVGIDSFTGIELTFVFTSPTTLEANVRATGEVCIERPALGEWDREAGAPDPDAPPDVELPTWAPPNFPAGDTRTVDVDQDDGGTFTVVFEDTQPNEVLLLLDEWADANGHVVASFAPGQPEDNPPDGSLEYTAFVELADGRVMDVDIVDIGGFDTRLTATISSG